MHAHFELTLYGWICRRVWKIQDQFQVIGNHIFVDVKVAPKHGYCKRPHYYL